MNSSFSEINTHSEEKIDEAYRSDTHRPHYQLDPPASRPIMEAHNPREAAEQSAAYYARVQQVDETLRHNAEVRLKNARVDAENLPEAETTLLFSQNFKHRLEEIRAEDDPAIRQTLWEDVLSLQSQYNRPHYVYGETTHAYTGKAALENDFMYLTEQDAKRAFTRDVFGGTEAAQEEGAGTLSYIVQQVFDEAQSDKPRHRDAHQLYRSTRRLVMDAGIPEHDDIPAEAWDNLQHSLDIVNEFLQYDGQTPISLELSERLTSHVDQYLENAAKYVAWASDKVEKYKADAAMTDEDIEVKARENFGKEKNPFIDEAAEHARRYLPLLKRAALAEAALDGVKIKTRGTAKKSD